MHSSLLWQAEHVGSFCIKKTAPSMMRYLSLSLVSVRLLAPELRTTSRKQRATFLPEAGRVVRLALLLHSWSSLFRPGSCHSSRRAAWTTCSRRRKGTSTRCVKKFLFLHFSAIFWALLYFLKKIKSYADVVVSSLFFGSMDQQELFHVLLFKTHYKAVMYVLLTYCFRNDNTQGCVSLKAASFSSSQSIVQVLLSF